MMPKLQDKRREEFCQQYVVDFNGARAARDAGFGPKSARVKACRILAETNVGKRIAELMANRSERTKITQDMVLQELAVVGFSNFTDFAGYTKKSGLIIEDTKKVNKRRPGATRAIKSMKQVDNPSGRAISIRLHDKVRPLELLGKHTGMFADTHNLNLTGDITVITAVPRPKKKEKKE